MRRVTEILSKPVISLYEGKTEGTVKNVIFSKELKAVKWLELFDDKEILEQKYLDAKDIFNIGENAVVVKNSENIVPNMIDNITLQNNPINFTIYTASGDFIDIVSDVLLDEKYCTLFLELKNGTQIAPEKIIITGQDALILQDENKPININSLKQKGFPKQLKDKVAMQKVQIMSVEENKSEEKNTEKVKETDEIVEKQKEEKTKELKEPENKKEPEQVEKTEKIKRPYHKKEMNTTVKQVSEPKIVKQEVEKVKEEKVKEVVEEHKTKATTKIKKEIKPKKEQPQEPPKEQVEPLKELDLELEKTEQELTEKKEELKEQNKKLTKEVSVFKKSIQKLIKPKPQKQPVVIEQKPVRKIVPPTFSENKSKPNKAFTNPTFLIGRTATKMVQTYQGEVIVKMNEKITQSQIELAFVSGKISELMRYSK